MRTRTRITVPFDRDARQVVELNEPTFLTELTVKNCLYIYIYINSFFYLKVKLPSLYRIGIIRYSVIIGSN